MKMKIVGDLEKAKHALKTNVPLSIGQTFEGTYTELSKFTATYPDVFAMVGLEKQTVKPGTNKKAKKSLKYKSK